VFVNEKKYQYFMCTIKLCSPFPSLIRLAVLHPASFYSRINIVHFDTVFATIVTIEKSLLNVIAICNYKTVAVTKDFFPGHTVLWGYLIYMKMFPVS
jgi:hypothetical protein